jgi:PRTRC genetic system protein D
LAFPVPSRLVVEQNVLNNLSVTNSEGTQVMNHGSVMQLDALAYDGGYRNAKTAYSARGRDQYLCYPAMCGHVDGARLGAWGAEKPDGLVVRVGATPHFVGTDAHHFAQVHQTRRFHPGYSATLAYKAVYLGSLAHVAINEGFEKVRIGTLCCALPLNTWAAHHATLKSMSGGNHVIEIEGRDRPLEIEVQHVIVARQPQGALYAQGVAAFDKNALRKTLVVDVGGGTTNFYLSLGTSAIISRCGCIPSGMIEVAERVAEMIRPGYGQKAQIVKRAEEALATGSPTIFVDGKSVTLPLVAVQSKMQEIFHQVAQGVEDFSDVDRIILGGGGAKHLLPVFAQHLGERAELIEIDANPVLTNCRGFLRIAEEAQRRRQVG